MWPLYLTLTLAAAVLVAVIVLSRRWRDDWLPDVGIDLFLPDETVDVHIAPSPLRRPAWDRPTGDLPILNLLPVPMSAPPLPLPMSVSMVEPEPWMVGPRPAQQLALSFGGASKVRPARVAALLREEVA